MTEVPNLKAVEKLARKNGWDYVVWTWATDSNLIVIFADENKVGVVPGSHTGDVAATSDHLWPFCLRDDINAILDRLGNPLSIQVCSVKNGSCSVQGATFNIGADIYVEPVVEAPVAAMMASLSRDGFAVPPEVLQRALEAALKEQEK